MKSKIFFVVGIILILLSTSLHAALEDRIVAVVNENVITLSELETALQPVMERIDKLPEEKREETAAQARTTIMTQMIDELLLEQEAAKLKIAVTDDEVDGVLKNLLENKGTSVEKFRETLAAEGGGTMDQYRDEVKKNLVRRKLINRTVKSKVAVSEEEIGTYYAKHRDEYEGEEAVRIQQILIVKPKDTSEDADKTARSKAEEILKQLKAGESFELLASRYSQGPAAGSGGDLGFVEKGMMFPAVDEAAFNLEEGEISDVIESPVGFHIIRITDRRGAGIKPIQEVREEIVAEIMNEKMKKKFEEWLKEVRAKSLIEIRL